MATKKEDKANSEKDASVKNVKADKITKTETVKGSGEGKTETESNTMMTIIMAMIVAIPTAAIVAYILLPGATGNDSSNNFRAPQQISVYPSDGNLNRAHEPEWLAERRAEMEKRRSEFEKYNTDHYAANRNSSEPPQWVKDRQAKMEQRRAEFEKQNTDNYSVNSNSSEPPQWVKDQQALMQQQQEKYQQEWAKRSANMPYNQAPNQPGYMVNPGMNGYQPNQVPVNAYAQPVNPYYYNNAPYSAPYHMPYGYPYR